MDAREGCGDTSWRHSPSPCSAWRQHTAEPQACRTIWSRLSISMLSLTSTVFKSDVNRDSTRPDGVASYQDTGAYSTREIVSRCMLIEARTEIAVRKREVLMSAVTWPTPSAV